MRRCAAPGCQPLFEPQKAGGRYRSTACRMHAYRLRKATDGLTVGLAERIARTADEIDLAVPGAEIAALERLVFEFRRRARTLPQTV